MPVLKYTTDGVNWTTIPSGGPEGPVGPQGMPGNRNRLINGDFSVNQRSFSTVSTGYQYGLDRWVFDFLGGTVTNSVQQAALGDLPESARQFHRVAISGQTLAGHFAHLTQKIEGVRTLSGKTVTASFWARAASGNPKVAVNLAQIFGTGGSPTVIVYVGQATLSTTWTRYSLTATLPSIAGKTIGSTTDDLRIQLFTSAGSDFNSSTGSLGLQTATIDFWGVQVEEGIVATPFEQKSYADELRACQRYYARLKADGSPYGRFGVAKGLSTTQAHAPLVLPVVMRAPPALGWTIGSLGLEDGVTVFPVTSVASGTSSTTTIGTLMLNFSSGITVGKFYELIAYNSPLTAIDVNAEI